MFWLGVKVLFFRQIYGFKNRPLMSWFSVSIPAVFVLLGQGLKFHHPRSPTHWSSDPVTPNRLTVIVTPDDSSTRSLMSEAHHIVQYQFSNTSDLELLLRFVKSPEDLNQSLADSDGPSIGVEFHNATVHQLEYTLRPLLASWPLASDNVDDSSPHSLPLRAAIDAAYIQLHFPNQTHFRPRSLPDLLNFDHERLIPPKIVWETSRLVTFGWYHCLWALGILFLITFFASYSIRDKANGVRELLSVNGLPRWMVNMSWLITFSLLATCIAIIEWIILILPPRNPVIPGVSPPLILVYLIVYNCTATFFVYFMANVIASALLLNLLIVAYWIITSFSSIFVVRWVLEKYLVAQAFVSLLPNVGTSMFWVAILQYSEFWFDKDVTFKNLFSTPSKIIISPGLALLMMMVSILIFLVLGLYFDAVKPGPYGRARPWYLIKREEKPTTDPWFEAETPSEALVYEPIKDGVPIGLECVNIVKKFEAHKALNKVNLKILKNNITVLLGHNGAGKTTLFSILCGMFSPTSGHVFTDEYNVFEGKNANEFRSVLGYCPQENLLMEELTAHEHLVVFGLLKGLVLSEAVEHSEKWTRMFDMHTMRETQASYLSGASKRKLCLAIAMTGNPQYLLLDEPSAGLDVESAKKFCDILLEEKENCTVIVTTHNMDEAEMLGERIAILAHGELKCYGTTSFLKRLLDTGYRLNCSLIRGMSVQDATKAVTNIIPGATVLYRTNHSVTFSLPVNKTNDIPDLLHKLESQFGSKISSTLSPSTLDDVFLKVQTDIGVKIAIDELPTIPKDKIRRSSWNFMELFRRRVEWMFPSRMLLMIFSVILFPYLMMIPSMAILNKIFEPRNPAPSEMNSSERQSTFAVVSGEHDQISDVVRSALTKNGVIFEEKSNKWYASLVNMTQKDLSKYQSSLLFAIDYQGSNTPTVYFPSRTDSVASMVYTSVLNALLQGNASVITHRSPFMKQQMFGGLHCPPAVELVSIHAAWFFNLLFGIAILTASSYFILFPHLERTSVFKHLQLMTGLLPAVYWLVNLLFDMLIYILSLALIIIITVSMDRFKLFLETKAILGAFILILILYGLHCIILSYVWSFFFRSSSNAVLSLMLINVVSIFLITSLSKTFPETFEHEYIYFLPWPILRNSVSKLLPWAVNMKCKCATKYGEACYAKKNPLFTKLLKTEIVTSAVFVVAYFLLLMLFDHGLGRKLKGGVAKFCCGDIRSLDKDVDPEVTLERKRVKDFVLNGNKDEQPELVVDGLGKNYGCESTAVYDVTLAAERGECFGLVGVNGSGKTTTFGMLAALISPTKGTAFIEGTWKVTGCEYNYIKRVGYCPQYNGLINELSGRTTLKLFGRLCGVPRSEINELVDKWINALDMAEIAKRPCGQYSGGNKRKLSLAIALIGNAPVVLLDEPTAGVDPVVRRRIWAILSSRLEQNQTIILTSHTMSECEAICDRLTIMVKGVMKCLGPIPTLKNTFGKRSILSVKFTTNSTIKEQDVVKSKIESEFGGYITLEERQQTSLKYILNTENKKMYRLFASMLSIQSDYNVIEGFNLVEAPLEEVFMTFATKETNKKNTS